MKTLPQNQVTKLNEVDTIIHIYSFKEEIKKATDEKYRQNCQEALKELKIHYQELSKKSISNYSPLEEIIKRDCETYLLRDN